MKHSDYMAAAIAECEGLAPIGSRIYLASRYKRRLEMLDKAADLKALGHEVVSSWIDGHHESRPDIDDDAATCEKAVWAGEDVKDLAFADTLIAFTEEPRAFVGRGGRHVELGIAVGWNEGSRGCGMPWGKRIVVVGPRENVFCCLPQVEQYDTWEQCLAALRRQVESADVEATIRRSSMPRYDRRAVHQPELSRFPGGPTGWLIPAGSLTGKRHCYDRGVALCGYAAPIGDARPTAELPDDGENCAFCRRRWEKGATV